MTEYSIRIVENQFLPIVRSVQIDYKKHSKLKIEEVLNWL